MKSVYDMTTGQIIDNGYTATSTDASAYDAHASELELRLQLVTTERYTKSSTIPPELVLADLNAFIETMS
ncbi:MAG: hypothetical protein P8179_13465 [Candidatus Thiodiazotropha sp.]|jgi:hypothetical protein